MELVRLVNGNLRRAKGTGTVSVRNQIYFQKENVFYRRLGRRVFLLFFSSVIVINMFCAIFGFVGLQSMTKIISSRKDREPNACCSGARLYVLSLGSCIILEKKQVLC